MSSHRYFLFILFQFPSEILCFEHMDKSSRWAIHAIKPLKSYASGSVVLLGDAVRVFFFFALQRH